MMKIFKKIALLVFAFFVCISTVNASASIPNSFKTDGVRTVEYIKNFPVIIKTVNNGSSYVYCIDMASTYAGGITFNQVKTVDDGFTYILKNKPNTSNKDLDFYITQVAVWYYEDLLNNNNENLKPEVKNYILEHREDNPVCKAIYNLYIGAKKYKKENTFVALGRDSIYFTKEDGYFVSSEITLTKKNTTGIKYKLEGAPKDSKITLKDNGNLVVKVPVNSIPEDMEIAIKLSVTVTGINDDAYYYFATSDYQKLLYGELLNAPVTLSDEVNMVVRNTNKIIDFPVIISKTDITKTKEVPGATLVITDSNKNVVATWVSTNEEYKVGLKPGKYTLTETIAPKGYKINKSSIDFEVLENGEVKYNNTIVNKIVMINELKDLVGINKLDKETNKYVAGAKLGIKNANGDLVYEFVSNDMIHYVELDPGYYVLEELAAPSGYSINKNLIYFALEENGAIKVKNEKGEYADVDAITFYNSKNDSIDVPVPATDHSNILFVIGGIALIIGGIACVKKTSKEC